MAAYDRSRVLKEIREELRELEKDYPDGVNVPEDRRITIISTSLIEAGVDLDVYTVFRERTGLDSILQAGGRCNREGKREKGDVFIFDMEGENGRAAVDERSNFTKGLLEKYPDINAENIQAILQKEVGLVFVHVLEDAGVYKCTPKGREDFMRFVDSL